MVISPMKKNHRTVGEESTRHASCNVRWVDKISGRSSIKKAVFQCFPYKNVQWKITIYSEFSHVKWWFSILMLQYVTIIRGYIRTKIYSTGYPWVSYNRIHRMGSHDGQPQFPGDVNIKKIWGAKHLWNGHAEDMWRPRLTFFVKRDPRS
jgi:hypothetical protein